MLSNDSKNSSAKQLKLQTGVNALIIVAHPDDETIWMGGAMLRFPDIKWTIYSLCRGDDPDRAPKFKRVVKRYGARGIISDVKDNGILTIRKSIPEMKKRIARAAKCKRFTYIFTHGYNGEYGHPLHIGAHRAVRSLVTNGTLQCGTLFCFSYRRATDGTQSAVVNARRNNMRKFTLTPIEQREKKRIIQKHYGFSARSFESRACLHVETFTTQPCDI